MIKKFLFTLFGLFLGLGLFAAGLLAIAILITYPNLPKLDAIQNYKPKMPLMVYSADGKLIGSYGEERRAFTKIQDFPNVLKNAVIAAEDKRFYEHWGVDVMGVARAAIGNITSGSVQSGASTITQQVAKNFYLSNERTFTRKFNEALLAYKIERQFTKDQILELYFNQIYLGQRAYGFAAASQIYFNKPVQELDLAEATILAGLPKAPSAFNPIVNPKRAKLRQEYILNNMVDLGMITPAERTQALNEPLHFERRHGEDIDPNALYVAEMVRQELYSKYGEDAYTQGFKVYTTVDSQNQQVATDALRKALRNFDRGSGYRGAEHYLDLSTADEESQDEIISQYLSGLYEIDGMIPAVVLSASHKQGITAKLPDNTEISVKASALSNSVRKAIDNSKLGDAAIRKGAVIRVQKTKQGWRVVQEPLLQGALVSIDARTGAVRALVGGYDFHNNPFNRATQAQRQPGSSFKPFIYSAGIERGITAATELNDAPMIVPGAGPNGSDWEPKNSDGRFAGYMTLRKALVWSRNIVSIRILEAIGVDYTRQYIQRFGLSPADQPTNLSMALGAGSVTPIKMAEAYALFANGGYHISPYVIDKIYDSEGKLRAQMQPLVAGVNARQTANPNNMYIMYKIMQDVTRYGTAARASSLGRKDIAGKTGTTNDSKDAWFVGFNPDIVTAVYIGYDKPRSMGRAGYGGTIALPVWIDYMRHALKGLPVKEPKMPSGVINQGGEYFLKEHPVTDPSLPLDNHASRDIGSEEQNTDGEPATSSETLPGEVPLEPIGGGNTPPANKGGNNDKGKALDALL